MRDMMRGPAIRDLIEAELVPGVVADDQAAIEEDIRARAATYFHPSRDLPHGQRSGCRR
jgi:hypothetical protein